jgi:hypothetical protein
MSYSGQRSRGWAIGHSSARLTMAARPEWKHAMLAEVGLAPHMCLKRTERNGIAKRS